MELYEHQKRFLKKNPPRHLLVHDTGTGKTRTAIEWSKLGAGETLIVCPKALRKNWNREIQLWGGTNVTVMTKEEFRRDWDKIDYFNNLIIDEAHYFAHMTSQMSKSLMKYLKKHAVKMPRVILLTATPYLSTPWNIYQLAKILGHEWGYFSFKQKFFRDRFFGRRVVPEIRPGMEQELAAYIRRIGEVVRIDECADVPEQVFEVEHFQLTKEQQKALSAENNTNAIVRFTRHHQIENGTLKSDGYADDAFFPAEKTDRLKELCQEADKVAVVCRYNLQIELYKKELAGLGKEIFVIQGETKDRDAVVRQVENSVDRCIILINASCSEGYELPSVGLCVFASLSFSYKDTKQMWGRFLRMNKLKRNVFKYLVCDGVDTAVYESMNKKQDFSMAIYAKTHGENGEGVPDGI